MEENLGSYLRRERESRQLALADVARTTKIPVRSLERLEAEEYDALPAEVFVRGFIKSYARCVGVDDEEALLRYDAQREEERRRLEEKARPVPVEELPGDQVTVRRRVGLAVFVVVILIIATITLSLLLRRPQHADGGVSLADPATAPPEARAG